MVDWDLAVATARVLVRPGPEISLAEAKAVAARLRDLVPVAERHVQEFTGLTLPEGDIPVAIVDRVGWVRANAGGFRVALEPLVEKLSSRRGAPAGVVRAVGSKVTGVEVGTIMAYLAARVLGQFELFLPPGEGDGRLTLVAPNIVETERRLGVDPDDFRLWVTLHEVTHKTQFTAVPWLRDYFTGQVRAYIDATDLDPSVLLERLKSAAGAARQALSGGGDGESLIELIQTPEQRVVLDRLQALMSLLEGHGDYVMDGVGPTVVPTAELIRARFSERRRGTGPVDRFVRRLLGLDLKLRQYAEGEAFVRHVVDAVGMEGFNRVWESAGALPTLAEIRDPDAWLRRAAPAAIEQAGPAAAGQDERA